MKTKKGDLILKENTIIDDDVKVEGNIRCEGGSWNLNCWNLTCRKRIGGKQKMNDQELRKR